MCRGRRNGCAISKGNGGNKLERRGRGVLGIIVYNSNDGDKMMRRVERYKSSSICEPKIGKQYEVT
jgi:hypothetical protein